MRFVMSKKIRKFVRGQEKY